MNHLQELAKIYNAEFKYESEYITSDTSPVKKGQYELSWSNETGKYFLKFYHSEHALSHNNSNYCELELKLRKQSTVSFDYRKVDILEKTFARILTGKNAELSQNHLLRSKSLNQARRILKEVDLRNKYIQSISVKSNAEDTKIQIISRENFIKNTIASSYIGLLDEIARHLKYA